MKTLLISALVLFIVAVGRAGSAQASEATARSTAQRFYRSYLKLQVRGLPSEKQLKVLAPLMDPDLKQLFDVARGIRGRYIKQHPEDKPPWDDGDLFSSLFEGANSFRIGSSRSVGDRIEIPVFLSYREGGSTTRWSDVMVLARRKGRWLVWDILFKGEWAFKNGNSLRSVLSSDESRSEQSLAADGAIAYFSSKLFPSARMLIARRS